MESHGARIASSGVAPLDLDASIGGGLRLTWLGHSTVLIELDGVRLLTDPLLRRRVAHLRRTGPDVDAAALADLDAVLVSHAHYDHFDVPSLRRLGRSVRLVVPRGTGRLLRVRGFRSVTELRPDDEATVGSVVVRATHAEHGGGRPFAFRAPSLGYLVSGSARLYFAGDTDLFEGMTGLAPGLDVALLPVAGWGARLPAGHLDPRTAAQAAARLRPRIAVPIHWGSYLRLGMRLRGATPREPAEAFARHAAEIAPDVDVRILEPGETLDLVEADAP
jgi:L-ascorbate metabolism protein UlaG (beta-lactamase superfamily)